MTVRNIQDIVDAITRLEAETASILAAHCGAIEKEVTAITQVRELEAYIAGDVAAWPVAQTDLYRDHLRNRLAENRGKLCDARSELDRITRDAKQRQDRLADIEKDLASWRAHAARLRAELAQGDDDHA